VHKLLNGLKLKEYIYRLKMPVYWHIYATIILVLLISFTFAWLFRNQINPDGVSYIQAARHYANFEFKIAINGYWSPLLSWLLVPAIWLNIEPLHAYRLVIATLSVYTTGVLLVFMNRGRIPAHLEKISQLFFLGSFAILINSWGTSLITPDVLSGVVLLTASYFMYRYLRTGTKKNALLLGALLALLYLSKSIGFYLALIMLAAVIISEYQLRKKITKNLLLGVVVFIVITFGWICLISLKYDKFTISTSSDYNSSLYGPQHPVHPQLREGYLPTRNPSDIWAWDDPSYFTLPTWKISENISYFFNQALWTAGEASRIFISSSPLIVLGLLAIFKKKNKQYNTTARSFILLSVLIIGAYSTYLYVEPRYLWIILIPLIAFSSNLIIDIDKKTLPPLTLVLGLIFLTSLISLIPTLQSEQINQLQRGDLKFVATESRKYINESASVAGSYVYQYCYYTNTRCVGNYTLTGEKNIDQKTVAQMKEQGIEYYVDFSDKEIANMRKIFHSKSLSHQCFERSTGLIKQCNRTTLNLYKIE
jgi:4-amino-4-deoxy-L-arabinose transferase-like glycosyltransferase